MVTARGPVVIDIQVGDPQKIAGQYDAHARGMDMLVSKAEKVSLDFKVGNGQAVDDLFKKHRDYLRKLTSDIIGVTKLYKDMVPGAPGRAPGQGGGGGGSRNQNDFIGPPAAKQTTPPKIKDLFAQALSEFKYRSKLDGNDSAGAKSAFGRARSLADQLLGMGGKDGFDADMRLRGSVKAPPKVPKKKTFKDLAMDMIMTTRIGGGSGGLDFAPLVGRTVKAISAMGPAGVAAAAALGIATGAVGAFAVGLRATNGIIIGRFNDKVAMGGSSGAARAAANMIGADPVQLAQSIRAAVGDGGFGTAAGIQAGIPMINGPRGNMDYGKLVTKAMSYVAGSGSFDQARRRAEDLGAGQLAESYFMTPAQRKRIAGGGAEMSEEDMRTLVQIKIAFADLMSAGKQLLVDVFGPFVEAFGNISEVATGLGLTSQHARELSKALAVVIMPFSGIVRMLNAFFGWITKWAAEFSEFARDPLNAKKAVKFVNALKGASSVENALNRNTEALNQNTRAVDGSYGGGQRFGSGTPGRFSGSQFGNDPSAYKASVAFGII
jgi:hypothetical protein